MPTYRNPSGKGRGREDQLREGRLNYGEYSIACFGSWGISADYEVRVRDLWVWAMGHALERVKRWSFIKTAKVVGSRSPHAGLAIA